MVLNRPRRWRRHSRRPAVASSWVIRQPARESIPTTDGCPRSMSAPTAGSMGDRTTPLRTRSTRLSRTPLSTTVSGTPRLSSSTAPLQTMSLYLDGQFIGSVSGSPQDINGSFNQVGTGYTDYWPAAPGGWYGFQGEITNVHIWSLQRSGDEVAQDMSSAVSNNSPGLAADYLFNEGLGLTAYDQTANHNDGTLEGFDYYGEYYVHLRPGSAAAARPSTLRATPSPMMPPPRGRDRTTFRTSRSSSPLSAANLRAGSGAAWPTQLSMLMSTPAVAIRREVPARPKTILDR